MLKKIELIQFLSKADLKSISKPIYDERFIVRDESDKEIDYKIAYRDDGKRISKK